MKQKYQRKTDETIYTCIRTRPNLFPIFQDLGKYPKLRFRGGGLHLNPDLRLSTFIPLKNYFIVLICVLQSSSH